ncbi:MAG: ATP-binding cassette domain-containing protein [Cyclobacteriaceae bacterium]
MSTVIEMNNLSKSYRLGQFNTGALSGDIQRWWALFRGKEDPYLTIGEENDKSTRSSSNIVWSLRDINFKISEGEVIGVVGRNGAGKSTLLKLLSRVTSPTTGTIKIKGRVASLLEVGTGFHPELTGRENVYLNGAILGMRKREISERFDEIVDFSGVERYIDTPVKRYSSGMRVRLGFAVAAHLQSEILIVDEVLAVGDAEFQKKCLGKMGDISKGQGRTILFVSHNMASVKTLCHKGLLLKNGMIETSGEITNVVNAYLSEDSNKDLGGFKEIVHSDFVIEDIRVSQKENNTDHFDENSTLLITNKFKVTSKSKKVYLNFQLKDENNEVLFTFSHSRKIGALGYGTHKVVCEFPVGFLNIGQYFIDVMGISETKEALLRSENVLSITIKPGERKVGSWMGKEPGFIRPRFNWILE